MPAAEFLSALVDEELHDHALDLALTACSHDDAMLERWNAYHLIGDLLRSPTVSPQRADFGFHQRFSRHLARESGYAVEALHVPLVSTSDESIDRRRTRAANDYSFRWKLLVGLASLAAVSAVAWFVLSSVVPADSGLAAGPFTEQVLIATPQGALVRDARLHDWMEAHRQLGSSPTQMPSGFLRSATFEVPSGNAGR